MRRGFTHHHENATILAYRRELELQAQHLQLTEVTVATATPARLAIDESELDPTPWVPEPDHAAMDVFDASNDGLEYISDLDVEETN